MEKGLSTLTVIKALNNDASFSHAQTVGSGFYELQICQHLHTLMTRQPEQFDLPITRQAVAPPVLGKRWNSFRELQTVQLCMYKGIPESMGLWAQHKPSRLLNIRSLVKSAPPATATNTVYSVGNTTAYWSKGLLEQKVISWKDGENNNKKNKKKRE